MIIIVIYIFFFLIKQKNESRHLRSESELEIMKLLEKDEEKVVKQGLMTKLGHIRKNWKRRFFRLYPDGRLCYYSDKGMLLNEIDIQLCEQISISTCSHGGESSATRLSASSNSSGGGSGNSKHQHLLRLALPG